MRKTKYRGYDGTDWVYSSTVSYDPTTDTHYMLTGDDWDNDDHWTMVVKVSPVREDAS